MCRRSYQVCLSIERLNDTGFSNIHWCLQWKKLNSHSFVRPFLRTSVHLHIHIIVHRYIRPTYTLETIASISWITRTWERAWYIGTLCICVTWCKQTFIDICKWELKTTIWTSLFTIISIIMFGHNQYKCTGLKIAAFATRNLKS